ncbi:MAG: hypothetical protein KW788_04650 [Candidatus Doudnabacteria bacterium]|nr:hypothetical protein [Candidatus Doudnabacteria bacterium]
MTKLITAGSVLVLAIVFGLIFWNQLSSNQQQLAGGDSSSSQTPVVHNDNLDRIDADLSSSSIENIDSDSSQMDAKLRTY